MRVSALAAALYMAVLTVGITAGHNILSALAPHTPVLRASVSMPVEISPPSPSSIKDPLELRQVPGVAPVAAPPAAIVAPVVPPDVPPVLVNPLAAPPAIAPPVIDPVVLPAPVNPPAAVPPAIAPPVIDPAVAPAPINEPAAVPPVAPAPPPAAAIPPPPVNPAVPPVPLAPPAVVPVATSTLPLPPLVTGDDFVTVQWVETHISKLRTWVPKTCTFHFEAMSQGPLPGVGSIGMGTLTGKTGQTQTVYMLAGEAPTPVVDAKKAIVAAMAAGAAGLVL